MKGMREDEPFRPDGLAKDHNLLGNLPPGRGSSWARGVSVAAAAAVTAAVATTVGWGSTVAASGAAIAAATGSTVAAAKGGSTTANVTTHTTHIASGIATPTTASTASASTISAAFASNALQEGRDFLMSLLEKVNQLTDNTTVATVEEGSGDTSVTRTTGTTNAVNVVINIGGKIIVNDVGDVWNIKTTSSDSSSNQNRATSGAEHLQSTFTLTLGAITVNSSCREALVQQEVGESIRHTLGLHEDESETARAMSVKDIKKDGTLVVVLDILDLLSDVLRGRADTTDGEENVVLQEVPGKHLNIARESGREHQSLALIDVRHVFTLYDAANLRLETHVQHTIGLVENQVLNVNQRDAATLDQVNQTTGGSDQEIAATLDLTELRANIGTTVDNTGANPRAVSELAGFVKDLRNKLTSGGEDQGSRVRLALTTVAELARGLSRHSGRTCLECLRENGEQETTSLSGTSLSTRHEIATVHNDGNGVLLDGSRG
jgi:hypothetical protein